MSTYWGVEWLNANSQRSYPFSDDATQTDVSGDFTIPDDFLCALYLPVHAGQAVSPDQFFLRVLTIFGTGYTLWIAYNDGSLDPPIVASATIPRSTHTEGKEYALAGLEDFVDTIGKVVIGRTDSIDRLPAGQYQFAFADGMLDQDCIRPMIRGVSSLTLLNGSERSDPLYGAIELVAGQNIRLTPIIVGEIQQVRIDAIEGEGLTEECACDTSDEEAPPIRTINGVAPTSSGDFTLLGTDCLTLEAIANGLRLSDRCAQPCCGCEDLERVTSDLTQLGIQATTLNSLITSLDGRMSQFATTILGSQLHDRSCSCE